MRRGWSDQEIANLIIAFRRQHGNDSDLQKAMQQDYIQRTLKKVKPQAGDSLRLLPFKVTKVEQIGQSDATITLVLDDGKKIDMGSTDSFLSSRRAKAKLWEQNIALSSEAQHSWERITKELISIKEIIPTIDADEDATGWVKDYLSSRAVIPKIKDPDKDFREIFAFGSDAMAIDKKGRVYFLLNEFTRYVKVHTWLPGINPKSVAGVITKIGFKKRPLDIIEADGTRRQISVWYSRTGFFQPDEEEDADADDT